MSRKSLFPPRYVNVESRAVYDLDLPDPLFRTFVRIKGLAWDADGKWTPPLTVEELAAICGKKERAMWGHLTSLRKRQYITWETMGDGRIIIRFNQRKRPLQKFAELQNFAVPSISDDDAAADISNQDKEQQQSSSLIGVQKDAVLQNFAVEENLQALAEFGVNPSEGFAKEVAALPHVTPELIRAWGEHYRMRKGIHNLPGLLLHTLRNTTRPPKERRKGGQEILPEDLKDNLIELGIRGGTARGEILKFYAEDPERVRGWVDYVLAHRGDYTSPAGFLLSMLRSGDPPPEANQDEDNPRRYITGRYAAFIKH